MIEVVSNLITQLRNAFRQIFDKSKETIIYRTITRTRDTDDNPIESISDSNVYATVQIVRLDNIQEFGGMLQVGDAIVFFDYNTTVSKDDRIVHQNIQYKIIGVTPEWTAGNLIFTQAFCKREEYRYTRTKTLSDALSLTDATTQVKNP